VIWWTAYAKHYLSEEQLAEMAVGGRLQTPLQIPLNQIEKVPVLPDVEVPLTPSDVKKGLEFLRQAGLVTFKVRERVYEVKLRQNVRLPAGAAAIGSSQKDIAVKIINRWATYSVKKPLTERPVGGKRTKSRRHRDTGPTLFPL
jgi:ABC-type metal ion transport system substrate-binding protein